MAKRLELTMQEKLDMTIPELGLNTRTINFLERKDILTVRSLLQCTAKELLEINNFGKKSLEEVYKALALIGFKRRGE